MTWDNEREKFVEQAWKRLDELDAELDELGIEDALDWEKFPEMERVLGILAWNRVERWADRSERWVETAEMAEEAAMNELAAFGFVEPPDDYEELGEFAMADSWVNFLESEFENGRIGGAEMAEYDECMAELTALLAA